MKNSITSKIIYSVFLLFFALILLNCEKEFTSSNDNNSSSPCIDTNCADYTSQAAAQAAYDADPDCRGDLDADNDGIACEEPGNSVTICPTTANCGCSGLNKSPCQSNVCCRWVVNEGCKCK